MSKTNSDLQSWVSTNLSAITTEIAELVRHESPSTDAVALAGLSHKLAERYRIAGGSVQISDVPSTHLQINFGVDRNTEDPSRTALILVHFDTVWPVGTLADMPVSLSETRMTGPGIFDMKTSLVMIPWAIQAIKAQGLSLTRSVTVLLTSDEEIGSPTSRKLIETVASTKAYVLVLEPPLPGGRLKTERKGVGQFRVEITGKSAHAGIEPDQGANAIVELAHQILQIQFLARPDLGTTLNVGVIDGGTTPNVVAANASAMVDVRVRTMDEARRIEQAFADLSAITPGTSVQASGTFRRPPMERTRQSVALYEHAQRIGKKLGLDLEEGSTGGASDGNFTSALGIPTLDGLGCPGGGAHALHEHIEPNQLPARIALLAALLLELSPNE